jgi:hypothetical protein
MSILKKAVSNINLAFNGKEVESLGEILVDGAYVLPAITEHHTIVQGIVAKQQVGYLERLYKITKADVGCGDNFNNKQIASREKFWDPKKVEVAFKQCYTDLEQTFFMWAIKQGSQLPNLTETDAYRFILELLQGGISDDTQRMGWFGDTAAANVSGAGKIKNGVSVTDYTPYDGLWKRLFAIGTANASQVTAIAANAGASYAAQNIASTADVAYNTFQAMLESADSRIFAMGTPQILTTRKMLNNYKRTLRGKETDASFVKIENGQGQYMFDGVLIKEYELWDRTITADFDNGTKHDLPHRAVLTTKENLQLGYDSANYSIEAEYDMRTKEMLFRGQHKADTMVARDYLVHLAY